MNAEDDLHQPDLHQPDRDQSEPNEENRELEAALQDSSEGSFDAWFTGSFDVSALMAHVEPDAAVMAESDMAVDGEGQPAPLPAPLPAPIMGASDAVEPAASRATPTPSDAAAPSAPTVPPEGTVLGPLELQISQGFHQRSPKDYKVSNLKVLRVQLNQFRRGSDGKEYPALDRIRYRMELYLGDEPLNTIWVPELSNPPLLLLYGDTEVEVTTGSREASLHVGRGVTSHMYRKHRRSNSKASFRLRIAPTDAAIAAQHPQLTLFTHPFTIVTKLCTPVEMLMPPPQPPPPQPPLPPPPPPPPPPQMPPPAFSSAADITAAAAAAAANARSVVASAARVVAVTPAAHSVRTVATQASAASHRPVDEPFIAINIDASRSCSDCANPLGSPSDGTSRRQRADPPTGAGAPAPSPKRRATSSPTGPVPPSIPETAALPPPPSTPSSSFDVSSFLRLEPATPADANEGMVTAAHVTDVTPQDGTVSARPTFRSLSTSMPARTTDGHFRSASVTAAHVTDVTPQDSTVRARPTFRSLSTSMPARTTDDQFRSASVQEVHALLTRQHEDIAARLHEQRQLLSQLDALRQRVCEAA